jgi:hypothetical protein
VEAQDIVESLETKQQRPIFSSRLTLKKNNDQITETKKKQESNEKLDLLLDFSTECMSSTSTK